MMQCLQWSLALESGCTLVFLFLSFEGTLVHLTTSVSLGILPPFSTCSSSYHDLTVYMFLQFTHDGMKSNWKLPSLRWCIIIHELSLRPITGWEREGLITLNCTVPSDMERGWSLRLHIEKLMLDWGTFEQNPHWGGKLCSGHQELGLCSSSRQWLMQDGTLGDRSMQFS